MQCLAPAACRPSTSYAGACRTGRLRTVRCSAYLQQGHQVRASRISSPDEDREVMHSAYMHAFENAQPETLRVIGMQEFAGALLSRQRIPSQAYSDPLLHVFDEFDTDRDGHLGAHEVAQALRSRQVDISDEQAAMFVDAVSSSHQIERSNFHDLIMHMAAADLHSRKHTAEQDGENWVLCSWEGDDEIQTRLKSWVDGISLDAASQA